jgi:putative membrane protein
VPARRLHVVQNRDVFLGQLLTPQVWALPIALAFVVTQALMEASWGFIGVASTLTAAAGIVLQPVRRVLDDWNFRLDRDEAGLRMRHGLLETRHQTVPVDRVQAVRITWPLLWRVNGWLRMRMDVAGFAGPEQQKSGPADNLLPVGDEDTARRLLSEVLPGVDLADVVVSPPPRRARWLDPLAQPRIGAALTADVFVARSGVLTRRMALVPYARVQSVRIVQGPVQRMLGLATVYADTAAGSASAEHRELAEAREFAARLTDLARLARATSAPPAPPPGT